MIPRSVTQCGCHFAQKPELSSHQMARKLRRWRWGSSLCPARDGGSDWTASQAMATSVRAVLPSSSASFVLHLFVVLSRFPAVPLFLGYVTCVLLGIWHIDVTTATQFVKQHNQFSPRDIGNPRHWNPESKHRDITTSAHWNPK